MDITITSTGFIMFLLFLVPQVLLLRVFPQDAAVKTIGVWFAMVFVVSGLWSYVTLGIAAALGVTGIYSGLSLLYIIVVFSVIEASLTLRILTEIAKAGDRGISYKELLSVYNPTSIIKRRIERFVAMGDLSYQNGKYQRTTNMTPFRIRKHLTGFLYILFPQP